MNLEAFFASQGLQTSKALAHWGIKGMKWGIRRSDAELARARGEAPDATRARETQAAIAEAKSLSAVSDADLNHLVNRLNIEKRYADINPSAATKGHNAIKTLLSAGDTMNKAYSFATSPAGQLLYSKFRTYKPKHAVGIGKRGR